MGAGATLWGAGAPSLLENCVAEFVVLSAGAPVEGAGAPSVLPSPFLACLGLAWGGSKGFHGGSSLSLDTMRVEFLWH